MFKAMEQALEQLSRQQLVALVTQQQQAARRQEDALAQKEAALCQKQEQVDWLQAQVEQYRRMLFGQRRERFAADSRQLPLPFEASQGQALELEERLEEKIEYVRRKQRATAHKGRVALPGHLPVEEVEI